MTTELYHPILNKFVEYEDAYVTYLEEGNSITYHSGMTGYTLKKVDDADVLYVHGTGHMPLTPLNESIPEPIEVEDDFLDFFNLIEDFDEDDVDAPDNLH